MVEIVKRIPSNQQKSTDLASHVVKLRTQTPAGKTHQQNQTFVKLIWGFPKMVVPNNHGVSY